MLPAMCGRTEWNLSMEEMRETYGIGRWPLLPEYDPIFQPRFNIAPSYSTADKLIVRVARDGVRELVTARWWLIPRWWNKPLTKLPTSFNARAEDVAQKPMFRDAYKHRHCLVPASGWYEFQGEAGKKRAFHYAVPDAHALAFGGLYEEWTDPTTGEVVTSFAIVTTEPNVQAREVHDRMPLVIAPADFATWLDAKNPDAAKLMRPWQGALEIYRSSGLGNDPRVEGPEVAAPWVEQSERQGSLF
jgi:putative SOS response-associated peptidase YedK